MMLERLCLTCLLKAQKYRELLQKYWPCCFTQRPYKTTNTLFRESSTKLRSS